MPLNQAVKCGAHKLMMMIMMVNFIICVLQPNNNTGGFAACMEKSDCAYKIWSHCNDREGCRQAGTSVYEMPTSCGCYPLRCKFNN